MYIGRAVIGITGVPDMVVSMSIVLGGSIGSGKVGGGGESK